MGAPFQEKGEGRRPLAFFFFLSSIFGQRLEKSTKEKSQRIVERYGNLLLFFLFGAARAERLNRLHQRVDPENNKEESEHPHWENEKPDDL